MDNTCPTTTHTTSPMLAVLRHSVSQSRLRLTPTVLSTIDVTTTKRLSTDTSTDNKPSSSSSSSSFLSPESCYHTDPSPPPSTRWKMAVPAFLTHLAIGSPFAWSVFSPICQRELGFLVPAAADWSFYDVTMPMSIVFALQGLAAAAGGKWQMKVGPRFAMATAGLCFGGGLMLGAAGIATHNLWLLYGGYGLLAGTGVGLGYTPPVQALVEWFPDRRAIATGLTIAGFGSGAVIATPLTTFLCKKFSTNPQYLGTADSVDTVSRDGRLFTDINGTMSEVVVATKEILASVPYDGLMEGVYVVGTGNTGAAAALATMGAGYLALMTGSALAIRRPAPGYRPAGWDPDAAAAPGSSTAMAPGNVTSDEVLKTPQFYHLAVTFFCISSGGIGLFSVAKPMMTEIFSSTLPAVVTSGFASAYVLALSAGNLGGRLGWAALSDVIGRRPTFSIITWASVPLYLAVPYCVHEVMETGSTTMLYGFIGASVTAVTIMGGVYAMLPAYESDMFGVKYVGANHGRMLLASTAAAMAGPNLLVFLRSNAEKSAILDTLTHIDPALFHSKFGAEMAHAETLITTKALTLSKLMEIAPAGVTDPSPYVYDSTMYTMAGLMSVAAVSHMMMGPVNPKHYEKVVEVEGTDR